MYQTLATCFWGRATHLQRGSFWRHGINWVQPKFVIIPLVQLNNLSLTCVSRILLSLSLIRTPNSSFSFYLTRNPNFDTRVRLSKSHLCVKKNVWLSSRTQWTWTRLCQGKSVCMLQRKTAGVQLHAIEWTLFRQVYWIRIIQSGKFEPGPTRMTGMDCVVSSPRWVRNLARAKAKVKERKCQTRALQQPRQLVLPVAKLSRKPRPKVRPITRFGLSSWVNPQLSLSHQIFISAFRFKVVELLFQLNPFSALFDGDKYLVNLLNTTHL